MSQQYPITMNLMPGDLHANVGSGGTIAALDLDAAHILRSKIIDKCAEAERQILRLIQAAGGDVTAKALFSQKIDALKRCLIENPRPLRADRIQRLLQPLAELVCLRSELAHSTLSIGQVEGETVAILWNAAEPSKADGLRRIISLDRLRCVHQQLSSIANSLRQEAERKA